MSIPAGILQTLFLFLRGKVKFNHAIKGKSLRMADGAVFTIFRRVVIRSDMDEPQAWFWIRFKPANMSPQANIRFSLLPMMVFMGFHGFRSKYWGVDPDSGLCQGLYEWQTVEDAENYAKSIAMRFMVNRSEPASVHWGIVDKDKAPFDFAIE